MYCERNESNFERPSSRPPIHVGVLLKKMQIRVPFEKCTNSPTFSTTYLRAFDLIFSRRADRERPPVSNLPGVAPVSDCAVPAAAAAMWPPASSAAHLFPLSLEKGGGALVPICSLCHATPPPTPPPPLSPFQEKEKKRLTGERDK